MLSVGNDTECAYRICQGGLDLVLPYMTRQILDLTHCNGMLALLDQPAAGASDLQAAPGA